MLLRLPKGRTSPNRRSWPGRPEVPDTSLLIPFFRDGQHEAEVRTGLRSGRLWLSSLVALELYTGTRDASEKRALDVALSSRLHGEISS